MHLDYYSLIDWLISKGTIIRQISNEGYLPLVSYWFDQIDWFVDRLHNAEQGAVSRAVPDGGGDHVGSRCQ
jgi:hypothetical protein